jgi:hypothetical protein
MSDPEENALPYHSDEEKTKRSSFGAMFFSVAKDGVVELEEGLAFSSSSSESSLSSESSESSLT